MTLEQADAAEVGERLDRGLDRIEGGARAEPETWVQPPVDRFVISVIGDNVYGYQILGSYVSSSSRLWSGRVDEAQSEEFAAWDMASDEALFLFEDSLR